MMLAQIDCGRIACSKPHKGTILKLRVQRLIPKEDKKLLPRRRIRSNHYAGDSPQLICSSTDSAAQQKQRAQSKCVQAFQA